MLLVRSPQAHRHRLLFDELAALYADAGITADLRPYFKSGGPVSEAYFAKPFLDQYLMTSGPKKGGYYGLPYGADTVVQFYNKKHFDEAGIPYRRRLDVR